LILNPGEPRGVLHGCMESRLQPEGCSPDQAVSEKAASHVFECLAT